MLKKVLFGKDARHAKLLGVQKINNAVKVTMGGAGKCVLVGNAVYGNDGLVHLPTEITKDGWRVTQNFLLDDAVEHRGAMLIKEAATKTMELAGDNTTLTSVLAEALITEGMKLVDSGKNSQQLKKEIDIAVENVVNQLKAVSTPVRDNIERVRQIATVSANNDKVIGDLIADAFSKIGFDGVLDIEIGNTSETTIKISEGLKFDKGWVSPLFVNKPAKEICEFENPLIILYEKKINHHVQIKRGVELSMQTGKPLLIICEDAESEGLAFLAMNNYQKKIQCCVVKSPEIGNNKRDWMEDIALFTGATYISDIRGVDIKKIKESELGSAKKVIVSRNETVIIEGGGDSAALEDFLNDLKMNLTQTETESEKIEIEKRIARLTGSVAVIQVGGVTETELKERLDRVDDAVRATKSAISEGFVPGGGVVLLKIKSGSRVVDKALEMPFKQICINAGVVRRKWWEFWKGESIYSKVKKSEINIGYDVIKCEIVNMVDVGIIDSTKAVRNALINAASVSGMLLTSECSITTIG